MDEYPFGWWFIQIMKPVCAVIFALSFQKFLLPLKKGWKKEDQKLINKGMIYLFLTVASITFFVWFMKLG